MPHFIDKWNNRFNVMVYWDIIFKRPYHTVVMITPHVDEFCFLSNGKVVVDIAERTPFAAAAFSCVDGFPKSLGFYDNPNINKLKDLNS